MMTINKTQTKSQTEMKCVLRRDLEVVNLVMNLCLSGETFYGSGALTVTVSPLVTSFYYFNQ